MINWLRRSASGGSAPKNETTVRDASVAQLVAARIEVEDELHRRARVVVDALKALELTYCSEYKHSVTVLSLDGQHVLVAGYEDSQYGMAVAVREGPRFPPYGGDSGDREHRRYGIMLYAIPLAAYEAGIGAVVSIFEAKKHEDDAKHEEYERRRLAELQAKYGGASSA